MQKYNIGLDVGITGVGWCVTDDYGRILRNGKKHLWGTVKFDEAETAKDRRLKRSRRRRLARKKVRITMLQSLMSKDVLKADPEFYHRMEETSNCREDRQFQSLYKTLPASLFADGTVKVNYNNKHLPIYQIRNELVHTQKRADIRYVYLAIHHIFKSRGHFLNETITLKTREDAEYAIQNILLYLKEECGLTMNTDDDTVHNLATLLENRDYSNIPDLMNAGKRGQKAITAMLALLEGNEAEAKDIFKNLPAGRKFSFKTLDDTEAYDEMDDEEIDILLLLNAVYRYINNNNQETDIKNISQRMTDLYKQHKQDLATLKGWIKKYQDADTYKNIFHNDKEHVSYNAYSGSRTKPSAFTDINWNRCSQEVFFDRIAKLIMSCKNKKGMEEGQTILNRMFDSEGNIIPNGFLPLQRIRYNQKTPNSDHLKELVAIIDNQSKYYPSLQKNRDKIIALCTFIIPYSVGPLCQSINSPFKPWITYKPYDKTSDPDKHITPWNFENRIDMLSTAENYITSLTNNCTFLPNEKVLPKHSLAYEEFQMLEELNKLRVRYVSDTASQSPQSQQMSMLEEEIKSNEIIYYKTECIPAALKREIIDKFFYIKKKVRIEEIAKWLQNNHEPYRYKEDFHLANSMGRAGGYFKCSLQATQDMLRIFAPQTPPAGMRRIDYIYNKNDDLEKIIRWSTVYKDRNLYKTRIRTEMSDKFTESEIRQLERLRYAGWGRFCGKLLKDELCDYQGSKKSVLQIMRSNSLCFMQIYHRAKVGNLKENIAKLNANLMPDKITYETIEEYLPCSPSLRRGIWTAVKILQEIEGYMATKPKEYVLGAIYIRNQRNTNAKRSAEKSLSHIRYSQIKTLYKDYEKATGSLIDPDIKAELEQYRNEMTDIRYLYFMQLGRCMYTGLKIDLNNPSSYITDNIIPPGLLADETMDNKILILQEYNTRRYNQAMPDEIISKMESFWDELYKNAFITHTKHDRLIKEKYTEQELHYFLHRQWTETSLIMENLTRLLKNYYNSKSREEQPVDVHIYGINSKLVSQIRNANQLYYIKSLNDAQQAYDAFLTAHIGSFADKYFFDLLTNEESPFRREITHMERLGLNDKNGLIVTMYNRNQPNERDYDPSKDLSLFDEFKTNYITPELKFRLPTNEDETKDQEASPWTGIVMRKEYINNVYYWHDGYVNYIQKEYNGQFYNEKICRPDKKVQIPVKDNKSPNLYGGHINAKTAYMAVIAYEEGKKEEDRKTYKEIINVPVYIAAKQKTDPGALLKYIREKLMYNAETGFHNVRILKNKVMLHQEIILDGHPYYLMSASELMSAKQLYIKKEYLKTVWTATTMELDKEKVDEYLDWGYLDADLINETLVYILDKLLYQYNIYPLLCRQVQQNIESLYKMSTYGKVKMIANIINAMNTQSIRVKGSLSEIVEEENKTDPGLKLALSGDNRLNNRRIRTESELVFVHNSVTGVHTHKEQL